MPEQVTDEDLELLADLGVETAPVPAQKHTARDQRIIAGFEEIERFVEEHGRAPEHGENRDIFERLYAVRLDRIRESAECRQLLTDLDSRGLLGAEPKTTEVEPTDEDLLNALGAADSEDDVTRLVHVRPRHEIRAAEEIARRITCNDFDAFKPIFEQVQRELNAGQRQTDKYEMSQPIHKGDLFILDGQKALVVDMGEEFVADYERLNRRLRVVYDNGTESAYLLRSLQRALYKTPNSRRILKTDAGPLFAEVEDEDDVATGSVYVLRSLSDDPFVAQHRDVIHKIGVTGGDVKSRVANAKKDPTYLLADVDIVAVFKLANVNRKKLEAILHKVFAGARLDMELKDRFGSNVEPREWFLVPLPVIDEAIQRIKDGTIGEYRYDPASARLARA
jgi:hypothetical protein